MQQKYIKGTPQETQKVQKTHETRFLHHPRRDGEALGDLAIFQHVDPSGIFLAVRI